MEPNKSLSLIQNHPSSIVLGPQPYYYRIIMIDWMRYYAGVISVSHIIIFIVEKIDIVAISEKLQSADLQS